MYCSKCGGTIDGAVKFCPHCAAPLEVSVAAVPQPTAPAPQPKKKKTAIIIVAVVLAVLLAVFVFFLVKYLDHVKNGPAEVPEDLVKVAEAVAVEEAPEITNSADSLDDMVFVINNVEYQFPIKFEEFIANGWDSQYETDKDYVLKAGETVSVRVYCGEKEMVLDMFNPTKKGMKLSECFVGSINPVWVDVILPGNIKTYESTRREVKDALGMPDSDSYHIWWHYGEIDDGAFIANENKTPYIELKFDDNTKDKPKDGDLLKYVRIQWYDPDAAEKYEDKGGAE